MTPAEEGNEEEDEAAEDISVSIPEALSCTRSTNHRRRHQQQQQQHNGTTNVTSWSRSGQRVSVLPPASNAFKGTAKRKKERGARIIFVNFRNAGTRHQNMIVARW